MPNPKCPKCERDTELSYRVDGYQQGITTFRCTQCSGFIDLDDAHESYIGVLEAENARLKARITVLGVQLAEIENEREQRLTRLAKAIVSGTLNELE